jgi:hypothetical protein
LLPEDLSLRLRQFAETLRWKKKKGVDAEVAVDHVDGVLMLATGIKVATTVLFSLGDPIA